MGRVLALHTASPRCSVLALHMASLGFTASSGPPEGITARSAVIPECRITLISFRKTSSLKFCLWKEAMESRG